MADGKAYDAFNPEKRITDPNNLGANREFPAHVFKWGGYLTDEDGALVTEGRDKKPIPLTNDYLVVGDENALDAALRAGWSAKPVTSDPSVAPDVDADVVPAQRKPGRPKGA